MKTPSLIAAAFMATATLGACSGTTPTGHQSKAPSASLELSNSPGAGSDSASVPQSCLVRLPAADSTTGEVGAQGTYAVAYGTKGCPAAP